MKHFYFLLILHYYKFVHRHQTKQPFYFYEIHRNFLYVTDHARGNRLALSSECDNQIINLEGPEKITLNRVAGEIVKIHGDVTISYIDQRQGDYTGKIVSNSRALELMGWTPTVDFTTGTNKLYDHIRQQNIDNSTTR